MRHTLRSRPAASGVALLAWCLCFATAAPAGDSPQVPVRPVVPGVLRLHLRERKAAPDGNAVQVVERTADWEAAKTAIIVCDMWDDHLLQVRRPARRRHGPADERGADRGPRPRRADHPRPQRHDGPCTPTRPTADACSRPSPPSRRCRSRSVVRLRPGRASRRCRWTRRSARCDDPVVGPGVPQYTREHAGLDIIGYDGISDNGAGDLQLPASRKGITNVVLMGVHTNMCVLGRPFGIRQMVRARARTSSLARDLTDAMYDPRQPPYVSHTRGTELVIEHIEQYWCPSIRRRGLDAGGRGRRGPK